MSIKTFVLAAASLASVALPGAASAQAYGYGYGDGYYGAPGRYDGYYRDRYDDRRIARERREEFRRWREFERRRRWEWAHRHHHRDWDRDGDDDDGYRYRDYGHRY